jgi:hypothetical protein
MLSYSDVKLKNLKTAIESRHNNPAFNLPSSAPSSTADLKLGASGERLLVYGGQTVVRKENENDFLIEGPPGPTFWEAREVLYQQFTTV